VKLTEDQIEQIKERIDRHDQDSDCNATGGCCSYYLIEYLKEFLDIE